MIFYVTLRALWVGNEAYSPNDMLRNGFKGLSMSYKCLCVNLGSDGRMLYEIQVEDQNSQDAVIEALSMFGAHLKTLDSALAFANQMTGKQCSIDVDKIIIPE